MASAVDRYIREDRDFANRRGDFLNQEAQDVVNRERDLRNRYRFQGDEVYDPLIYGRGGYDSQEQRDILREGDLRAGMTTPEEYASNYVTPEEYNRISGSPWQRAAFFDPQSMEDRSVEASGRQRDAVQGLTTGLNEGITPDLGLSDEFGQATEGTLAGTEGKVRGAIDPGRLRTDPEALRYIRMTPEEEQDIVTGAGISAGTGHRAAIGDIERSSRAAGLDPVGTAAVRARYERNAAADAGDAMTQARIQASAERARRAESAENLRRSGETAYTDRAVPAEMELGGRRLNTATTKEGMRIDSARDVSNRRMSAASESGQARIGVEGRTADQEAQQRQFNAGLGTDIATGIERDEADRARYLTENRQTTGRANQGQRYQQGYDTSAALSDRSRTVADAKRADAQEGRGYIREQASQANANEQAAANRQVGVYGTQGGMQQSATQNAIQQDRKPKWWEKAIGAGVGAAAAAFGGG